MFQRYHMDHHVQQGDIIGDVDIPSRFEGSIFRNAFAKAIWVFLQPVFYITRPLVVSPKKPNFNDAVNWITCFTTSFLIGYFFGAKPVVYLFISGFFGSGLHPVAGHFIAEHYVFKEGQETYSYYGPLNKVAFNVGYHNEHHDFPRIPGSRLPQLKKIAGKYYDNLETHSSWVKVMWDYIMDPTMGPYCRVVRDARKNK
jgi:sphingolipid 4-desaturase/C4-monooxygenase